VIKCQECGCVSDESWRGWRAYRCDIPAEDPERILVFFCADCAVREFGPLASTSPLDGVLRLRR
jgi:hypothetical protein